MANAPVTVQTNSFHYAKRRMGLVFIGISVIVLSLDNTILNVALPSIARDLNASITELQWIVDGYILVFAALLLTMGTLGDRLGRKRALQVGLVLFGAGSLAAALAPNTLVLIVTRMFLGVAGALMLPATLSIVTATFQPEERANAIATWASLFSLGVAVGPVLGGFLVQAFSWHAVFLVNLPVVAVALIGGQAYLGETQEPNAPRPDIVGSLLSIVGLFALVYGIIQAGMLGWGDPQVLAALAIAAIFLALFAMWEARTPFPMLPLDFFRNPAFTGANITLTLLTFSLFGAVFFMPQYLQLVLGYPAAIAGLMILPLAATLTFVTSRSARVAQRLGTKRTVALGASIAATSLLYMAFFYRTDVTYFPVVLIGQILLPAGMGLAMSPATHSIMSSVPVSKAGVGSAMNDTTRQLGGALGVAVLGTITSRVYQRGVAPLQTVLAPEAFRKIAAGLPSALNSATQGLVDPNLLPESVRVARLAFATGMREAFFVGALIMYGAAAIALWLLPDVVAGRRLAPHGSVAGQPPARAKQPQSAPVDGDD